MKRPSPPGLDEALDEPHKAQARDPQARASVPPAGGDGVAAAAAAAGRMKAWADGQRFGRDERGEEQLVDENGTQVMMAWERPYMVRCIDALQITESDSVLEVGFGCGYSADRIQAALTLTLTPTLTLTLTPNPNPNQAARPRQHTIIECAEPVLVRLRAWAAERPSVVVVEGTWQATLPDLGTYDAIFFDDFGALPPPNPPSTQP